MGMYRLLFFVLALDPFFHSFSFFLKSQSFSSINFVSSLLLDEIILFLYKRDLCKNLVLTWNAT